MQSKLEDIVFYINVDTSTHQYIVKMEFISYVEEIDLILPSWSPGSYMIRDYSRHLHSFRSDSRYEQIGLSRWRVAPSPYNKTTVYYFIYAFEDISVRTNHLDEDFGFIQPTALFLYPDGLESNRVQIEFSIQNSFEFIYTQLNGMNILNLTENNQPKVEYNRKFRFTAENYDILFDSPFFMTNQKSDTFQASGIPHEIVIQGEINSKLKKQLFNDLQKVIEIESNIMGSNPNDCYLFILILIEGGYGGLEHLASSINIFDRSNISESKEYKKLVELLAHEYFHLWNGKRIRPIALGPFDYENPNLTKELWIAEGITSFYDAYFLLIAGILNESEYLDKISGDYHNLCDYSGEEIMNLEESSLTAWNKFYKKTSDSPNTSISYYTKGGILALCINIRILTLTDNKKNLSNVMRELYNRYYKNLGRGFTKEEFFSVCKEATGFDIYEEYRDYLETPKRIPLIHYIDTIGVEYYREGEIGVVGIATKDESGKLIVNRINRKELNKDSNIYLGDEILGIDEFRIQNSSQWKEKIQQTRPGDTIEVLYSRKGKIKSTQVNVNLGFEKQGFRFKESRTEKEMKIWKSFLNPINS